MRLFLHVRMNALAFACITAMLLLSACGKSSTPTTGATGTSTTTAATPTSATSATVNLQKRPSGSAALAWTASNETLNAKVMLSGLAPNSTHPAAIHAGTCAQQGNVIYNVPNITADAHGNANTTATFTGIKGGIPAKNWSLSIYNGPGMANASEQQIIACGDITNTNTSTTANQTVQVPLNSAPPSSVGQNPSGKAQLTLKGTILTVVLTATGLAPNSSHAAHIHSGSCAMQGPVIHPLTTLNADAQGNATSTTTISGVQSIPASGWYVNVHNSADVSTQTGFDPLLCGDVTMGQK